MQIKTKTKFQIQKNKQLLEKKLKVRLEIKKNNLEIKGPALEQYEAENVLRAINIGFPIKTALLLTNPEFIFEELNIKSINRKQNPSSIKSRIIGTKGKVLKTLEEISDCKIILKDNTLSIIGHADNIKQTTQALVSLIKGSKISNVYKILEKAQPDKTEEDLGLKQKGSLVR